MGKWLPLPGLGQLLQGTGHLLGKCPLCWQPLPLSHRGLRKRGALRAAERGLARWWTGHTWVHTVCPGVCVCVWGGVCMCTWGLLICRVQCECAGLGSWARSRVCCVHATVVGAGHPTGGGWAVGTTFTALGRAVQGCTSSALRQSQAHSGTDTARADRGAEDQGRPPGCLRSEPLLRRHLWKGQSSPSLPPSQGCGEGHGKELEVIKLGSAGKGFVGGPFRCQEWRETVGEGASLGAVRLKEQLFPHPLAS